MSGDLVIIPTYNEKENIERILRKVMSLDSGFDVLVVDDGSPDGTAALVLKTAADFPGRIHLIERSGKLGLGTAYLAGFKWGLERDYSLFYEMDADFSHNPDDLERLRTGCIQGFADVTIGSRYVRGGDVKNWSWDRRFLSLGASVYVRMLTGMPINDPTAGFVCYSRQVLEALDLDSIEFVGYAFQIEMKFKSHLAGFRLVEVPITLIDREAGLSKMSGGIIHEAIFGVVKLKWQSFFS